MLSAPLDHEAIAALVPHAGSMCLLHRAEAWDADRISCSALSHADPRNPLRRDGLLPAICGVEYALQAMALHGALTGDGPQPAGFLASLRGVDLHADRLDGQPSPLKVEAVALAREARSFIYGFTLAADGRVLVAGQAAVILPAVSR
ncbi:3-hydroxylacyl-ACP dehydratase [Pseudoroseomonas oryzae]|uniref:3-hydroxylacyl-ACP dehydratase n=2 Tax=Teichococcus oryzae TaxID=1608942 RepID=A0A5B2TGT7_9PROT|nr:3-hydroxylacyl-ACP dehydratase [Pseudoroseomonas oryzae]